ncbi:MAG: hypothetical protein LAO06_13060 [Acidobacteriia bacterium]|nr:hypothetical protein [Terriglobia bacterium]
MSLEVNVGDFAGPERLPELDDDGPGIGARIRRAFFVAKAGTAGQAGNRKVPIEIEVEVVGALRWRSELNRQRFGKFSGRGMERNFAAVTQDTCHCLPARAQREAYKEDKSTPDANRAR